MKTSTVVSLLAVACCIACQRPLGHYCTDLDLAVWCYQLEKGNRFAYHEGNCLGSARGTGSYEIRKDTIRFIFDPQEVVAGKCAIEQMEELADKVAVELFVYDEPTEEPIPLISVGVYQDDQLLLGRGGDFEGRVQLAVPASGEPLRFEVTYIGYPPHQFIIADPGRYHVRLGLEGFGEPVVAGQTKEFSLIKLTRDSLIFGGSDPYEWRKVLTKKR